MTATEEGWHELVTIRARPGSRYRFLLPNGMLVPDPASRFQPHDVHGPSEVIDPSQWPRLDQDWEGRPWQDAVIYELHVGAFTPEGTLQAAVEKLDHLNALGITAIEIMPVADFPGRRNWGYDGVLPYAVDSSYGRPEHFREFIEAAHSRQMMVMLDVVYNHFGPEGNYLHLYAPGFFSKKHRTPWGAAINFDGPDSRPVREFFIQNALGWLADFHLDGLRIDAVHAIEDTSPIHVLEELASRARDSFPGRHVHLILENDRNQAAWLERDANRKPRRYTAQWNDDVHHVLHTAITGEDQGYYGDYVGDTAKLGRALAEGFAFQGEVMKYQGSARGQRSWHLPPSAFINFLQNHDQIGNRALGDRISAIASPAAIRAAAAIYLLMPQIPLLFMGEEWGARSPFPFFCDFGSDLASAVREGRREEFAKFADFQDPAKRRLIPDPQAEETFASAKLNWQQARDPEGEAWMDWYRRILDCRRRWIVPASQCIEHGGEFEILGAGAVVVRWDLPDMDQLILAANLSAVAVSGFHCPVEPPIWLEGTIQPDGQEFAPWTVAWRINRASGVHS